MLPQSLQLFLSYLHGLVLTNPQSLPWARHHSSWGREGVLPLLPLFYLVLAGSSHAVAMFSPEFYLITPDELFSLSFLKGRPGLSQVPTFLYTCTCLLKPQPQSHGVVGGRVFWLTAGQGLLSTRFLSHFWFACSPHLRCLLSLSKTWLGVSLHRHPGAGVLCLVNDTDVRFVLNHDLQTTFPLTGVTCNFG